MRPGGAGTNACKHQHYFRQRPDLLLLPSGCRRNPAWLPANDCQGDGCQWQRRRQCLGNLGGSSFRHCKSSLANGTVGTDPSNGNQSWTTTTANDGTSQNSLQLPGGAFGTTTSLPTEMQVRASLPNGASVTFTENQAYNASGGSGQIDEVSSQSPAANSVTPLVGISGQQGFTFNGQSGQSLTLGVLTAGGTPVPGVSVRIANFQSSPTAACVTGPGADPDRFSPTLPAMPLAPRYSAAPAPVLSSW